MIKQIQIDNLQRAVPCPPPLKNAIVQAVERALATAQNAPAPCEVQISLIGPRKMRTLNRESRGIDRETDVLSFPYLEWRDAEPGQFTSLAEPPLLDMETGRVLLGDIVISMHRAAEQAEAYAHSLLRETCFLAVHGTLHLLVYDHMTEKDERRMDRLAQQILSDCGIFRQN